MLARIALDCDALLEEGADSEVQYELHERLLWTLERYGVLVTARDEHLLGTIRHLSGRGLRELWANRLPALRPHVINDHAAACLCQVEDYERLCSEWRGKAELALITADRARRLQSSRATGSNDCVELERLDLFSKARTLRNIVELAESPIVKGEQRADVWRKRFYPLAMHTDKIVICDRYAGTRLHEHYFKRRPWESGLRWFLKELSQCSTSDVHIITGPLESYMPDPQDSKKRLRIFTAVEIEGAVRRLAKELPGAGVRDLKLTIAPNGAFRDESHDRHLQFNRDANRISIWVGRGLEVFEQEQQGQGTACQYIPKGVADTIKGDLLRRATKNMEGQVKSGVRPWPVETQITAAS